MVILFLGRVDKVAMNSSMTRLIAYTDRGVFRAGKAPAVELFKIRAVGIGHAFDEEIH